IVIPPNIRSIATSISSRTPPRTFPIFRPTGHFGFGLCRWREKTPGDSTVRYTSRSVICSGLRARRDPPPAPVWETTRLPCARSHNILLITTGLVLTLPAISSDFRDYYRTTPSWLVDGWRWRTGCYSTYKICNNNSYNL